MFFKDLLDVSNFSLLFNSILYSYDNSSFSFLDSSFNVCNSLNNEFLLVIHLFLIPFLLIVNHNYFL